MTAQNAALRAYWTPVFNIFNPALSVLGPKLEPCYVERQDSPLRALILSLQPDRVSQKILFTGQRGSGKSSALARLAHTLSEGYLLVWIDLETSLDVWSLSILELLVALGGGVYKVARNAGLAPEPQAWQDMVSALGTLIGQAFDRPAYQLDAEDLLQSVICARGDPQATLVLEQPGAPLMRLDLDLSAGEQMALRVGAVLREMVARVNAIVADVESRAGRSLLVVVDGLDKAPRVAAQSVFENSSALAEVRCRTVYTLPYGLYKTSGFPGREYFEIHELPNVKLHVRGDPEARYEPGFEVMRQVAQLRLAALGMKPEEAIAVEALDRLVWGSGGVMRPLIRLMRVATVEAELASKTCIDAAVAEQALQIDRRARSHLLSPSAVDYLRTFERTGRLEEAWLSLLEDGNVVAYEDEGRVWYTVHPNVLPLLKD
jgi:hypothetical protein